MSTRNRIPPSLEPYLRLPQELSLLLITGTLGCSPNWLTARLIGSTINGRQDAVAVEDDDQTSVVLVSWMRDATFWKSELRRSMVSIVQQTVRRELDPDIHHQGLDLAKLQSQKRIAFIDCWTSTPNDTSTSTIQTISTAIQSLSTTTQNRKIHLILDEPTILLATGTTTTHDLNKSILHLRSKVHSTTIVCSADLPFLSAAQGSVSPHAPPSSASTPLETETAAFTVQQAHNARLLMACRGLATGTAEDVSGVLRVTRGADAYSTANVDAGSQDVPKECESLYLVNRDGSVKVFERGSQT